MGFKNTGMQLFKHILFTSCFVIERRGVSTCTANRIYPYSAEASLNGNVFAQPYQNDTVRICQLSGISVE